MIYTQETLEKSIPSGWRVPTREDMDAITGWAAGGLSGMFRNGAARGVNMCTRPLYNTKLHDIVKVDLAEIAMACGISMTMQGRIMGVNLDSYVTWPDMESMTAGIAGVSDAGRIIATETTTYPASEWTLTPGQSYTAAPPIASIRWSAPFWIGQGLQTCTWYQLTAREAYAHAKDILDEQADAQDLYCMDEYLGVAATRYCGFQSAVLMKWPYGAGGSSRRTIGCTVYCVRDVA